MDGTLSTVDWAMLPTDPVVDGGAADEPAPALVVLPARQPGWNKYVVAQAVPDRRRDVRRRADRVEGDGGLQRQPATTAELIAATPGVTALTALACERRDLGASTDAARTRCAGALIGVALAVGALRWRRQGKPDGGTGGSWIGGNVGSGGAAGGGRSIDRQWLRVPRSAGRAGASTERSVAVRPDPPRPAPLTRRQSYVNASSRLVRRPFADASGGGVSVP